MKKLILTNYFTLVALSNKPPPIRRQISSLRMRNCGAAELTPTNQAQNCFYACVLTTFTNLVNSPPSSCTPIYWHNSLLPICSHLSRSFWVSSPSSRTHLSFLLGELPQLSYPNLFPFPPPLGQPLPVPSVAGLDTTLCLFIQFIIHHDAA